MFREEVIELLREYTIDDCFGLWNHEFALVLRAESWLRNLHGDDHTDSLQHIDILEVEVFFFEEFLFTSILVDCTGECHLEADNMCSSFWSDHIVHEADNLLREIIFLVLEGNFDLCIVLLLIGIEDIISDRLCRTVQVVNIGLYPAFEEESVRRIHEFIHEREGDSFGQVSLLAYASTDCLVVEYNCREHRGIWPESHDRSMSSRRLTRLSHNSLRNTALVELSIDFSILVHPYLHGIRECVHDGSTHSMQSS